MSQHIYQDRLTATAHRERQPVVVLAGGLPGHPAYPTSAPLWAEAHRLLEDHVELHVIEPADLWKEARDADFMKLAAFSSHLRGFIGSRFDGPVHLVGEDVAASYMAAFALAEPRLTASCTFISSSLALPGNGLLDHLLLDVQDDRPAPERVDACLASLCRAGPPALPRWQGPDEDYARFNRLLIAEGGYEVQFWPEFRLRQEEVLARLAHWGMQRPCLVVAGGDDPLCPSAHSFALHRLLSQRERHAELVLFGHCGHFPQAEHPRRFADLFARFVESTLA